ncbi:beta-microseminoprotein-like [Branchiostoma floridae x Branchiostoma belcheri]
MSGMGVYVLMIVAMCATWREAEGAAFFQPLSSETTMYGSRPVVTQYCAWEGKKMMIGSSWKTTDCVTCACGGNGLHCTSSGVYAVPDHCMILIDETCQTLIVDAQDPYSDCDFGGNWAITG